MPKLNDLTGQKFGRLTVICKAPSRNKKVYWLCQCECGNQKQIRADALVSGRAKSCGCLHKEISKKICKQIGKSNIHDLTGKKFGEWTVLKDSGKRRENGSIIWTCQCSCGTIKDLESRYLLEGISTNCGCQKKIFSKGEQKIKELLLQNKIIFQQEKTFDNCFLNRKLRFDFYVNNQYLIEYDGQQHFITKSSEKSYFTPEKIKQIKEHDQFKNKWCKENNIPLIRIPFSKIKTLQLKDLLLQTSSFVI